MADGRNRSVADLRPDGGEPAGIIVDRLSPDGVVYDVVELSGGDPWIDPLATRSTDRSRPGDDRPRRVATWSPHQLVSGHRFSTPRRWWRSTFSWQDTPVHVDPLAGTGRGVVSDASRAGRRLEAG